MRDPQTESAAPALAGGGPLNERFGGQLGKSNIVRPRQFQRTLRLAVRIIASRGREPYGRSREFRLSLDDLDRLIAAALQMEAGA